MFKPLEINACKFNNSTKDIKDECSNIINMIPYHINKPIPIHYRYRNFIYNQELERIAPKYRPKIFVKISHDYGFEMGYCRGSFNNYRLMTFLCKNRNNNNWLRVNYGTYHDYTVVERLRAVFIRVSKDGRKFVDYKYHKLLSRDALRVYDMTDSNGYDVNWRWFRKFDRKKIKQTLKGLYVDKRALKIILKLGSQYPGRYCMNLWLEWLYLAMIAEFFPKKTSSQDIYSTATGKCVKALGIFQSLYELDMDSHSIAKFSKHKPAAELNHIAKDYLRFWNQDIRYSNNIK